MSINKFLKERSTHKGFKTEVDPDVIGLDFDIMTQDHEKGVRVAESCMIKELDGNFKWMRGFQNCFTGFPNDGKTEFTMFLMTAKSLFSGWKWVVWSPEMKSADFVDGVVKTNYNRLAYNIMATVTGKTPYKHIHEKYGVEMLSIGEMQEQKEWIEKHFIFLNPRKKDITSIYNTLKRIWEEQGYDGVLIDPFKNIEPEHNVRDDKHLHDVFSKFKDFATETNIVMNWIAHPKSGVNRVTQRNGQDILVPCNQYMLAGGAAWDNSMDGIYSVQRPDSLQDVKSTRVAFHNLKQRMQELVADRGTVDDIDFEIKTRRYLFNGHSPLGFNKAMTEDKFNKEFPEFDSENSFEKDKTPF